MRREDAVRREAHAISHDAEEEEYWASDDVSGAVLNPKMVVKARMVEIGYIREKGVWTKMSRIEAKKRGIRIVGTRWLDINKGDEDEMNYRSRLVAKDFNTGKEDGIFAATPPLEALKLLLTDVATVGVNGTEDKIMMINDVARAFFEADMRNELCVELPDEDKEEGEGDLVGYLVKSPVSYTHLTLPTSDLV